MKPTINYIAQKFNEFNKQFFHNSLPIPIFDLMSRNRALGDFTVNTSKNYIGLPIKSYMRIRLNKMFERTQTQIDETIIHEMIHQYLYVHKIYDNAPHGNIFMRIAKKIYEESNGLYNITPTTRIDDEETLLQRDKKRLIVIFDTNKFSILQKDSLIPFLVGLLKSKKSFHVYESDFIYFKQFKTCRTRITYYLITETNKQLFEEKILPKSKNITEDVFLKASNICTKRG